MQFTEKDLDTLSSLSRIDIDPTEKSRMLEDVRAILGYISEINSVEESSRGKEEYQLFNVVREDAVTTETGSKTASLLNEAPNSQDGYVQVKQVLA
jgi:aspartyl/glutamyl-tRNA(Asn/Gln) amidotransferase C subunit